MNAQETFNKECDKTFHRLIATMPLTYPDYHMILRQYQIIQRDSNNQLLLEFIAEIGNLKRQSDDAYNHIKQNTDKETQMAIASIENITEEQRAAILADHIMRISANKVEEGNTE